MTKPPRRLTIVPAHNSQNVLGNPLLRKNPSRPVIVAFGTRGSWSKSDRFYPDLTPVALPPASWGAIVHGATAPPHRPRGDPEDEAGQLVLVAARGEGPSLIASHAPGAFDDIQWIDEERMAVGYWDAEATFVDVVAVDGSRSAVGQGRLIGLMRR